MKTILLATDFSLASRNASLYGMELAKALNANIILLHSYIAQPDAPTLNVSKSRYDTMMRAEKRLLDEADFLDPKSEIIEIICDEGVAHNSIMNVANEKKTDFIIVGRKGNGEAIKNIFGSTATALAKNTNIPVIIVPEDAKFENPVIEINAGDSVKNIKTKVSGSFLECHVQIF